MHSFFPKMIYTFVMVLLVSLSEASFMSLDVHAQQPNRPVDSGIEQPITNAERFAKEEARLPDDASAEEVGIKIGMQLDKKAYSIGETINLEVTISNSNQYNLAEEPLCNDAFSLHLVVRNAQGEKVQLNESITHRREYLRTLRKWREGLGQEPADIMSKRAEAKKKASPGSFVVLPDDIRHGSGADCITPSTSLGGKLVRKFSIGDYYTVSLPGIYYVTYSTRMILSDQINSNPIKQVHISETTPLVIIK
jgi:hypothetical protein